MLLDEIAFDSLEPISVPVKIGVCNYTLREIGAEDNSRYMNALMKIVKAKRDDKGAIDLGNIEGVSDLDFLYLSYCLFDTDGKSVPIDVLKTWPNRIVKKLEAKAKEISGDGADPKGLPVNMTGSSATPTS